MRFTSIEIENVLAYKGVTKVVFPEPEEGKNIVLIWGRNGTGKTSFLTALKLLFTGLEDEQYRRVGIKSGQAAPRLYVLGDGTHWFGLFNRRALDEARRTGGRATARVTASWIDGDRTYQAHRSWTSDGYTYDHLLVVYDGEDRFVRDAAENRLEELLPKSFVGFFFFDGEEVKELAEGMGKRAVEVDRLLRLTFVNDLVKALDDVAQRRLRGNTEDHLREEIDDVEKELTRAQRSAGALRKDLADLEYQLALTKSELAHLQIRRENLSAGASGALREDLETRLKAARVRRKNAIEAVATKIPPLAPFFANFGLVNEALKAVDTRLKAAGTAEAVLIRTIRAALPEWIAEAPVELTDDQRRFLTLNLTRRLEALRAAAVSEGPFAGLPLERAEQLHALLLRWSFAGPAERDLHSAELENARQAQAELDELDEALMRLEAGSQASLDEYRSVVWEIAKREGMISEWNQRTGQLTERLKETGVVLERSEKRFKALREQQEQVAKNAHEARFIRKIGRSLQQYRDALRRTVKNQLEAAINTRFFELAYGHTLVARIELTDTYLMNFLDATNKPVARGSLSAGLKQLAATALLWAMKDVSGLDFPVVIDTPLGRIDRENQNNLLQHYYPNISSQVVVLPTNSEIDGHKLTLLQGHVAAHFLIENEGGDRAEILAHRQLVEPAA